MGSITHITDADGNVVQELSYDAWGRLRDPVNQKVFASGGEPELFLGRGYTGHEHLTQFGLINMNARLYDPALGRFLSPDPYVQDPGFSQNFNRYSYALNNPFKYTDESGEFWNFIIGGLIGGIVNWVTHGAQFNAKGLSYFGIGAAVGVMTAGIGSWSAGATKALGVLPGAAVGAGTGAISGAASSFALNGLNNVMQGQKFFDNWGKSIISGFISGAVSGAISGGIEGYQNAKAKGANTWTGSKYIGEERTYSTPVKVSNIQPNSEAECYAYALEYADQGHGNMSAKSILKANGNKAGENIGIAAQKAGLRNVRSVKSLDGIGWEELGREMQQGTGEVLGTISQGGNLTSGHAVNTIQIRVQDKLRIFGGGVKTVFRGANVWNPIGGVVQPQNSFLDIAIIRY